jgi:hypothetical protein
MLRSPPRSDRAPEIKLLGQKVWGLPEDQSWASCPAHYVPAGHCGGLESYYGSFHPSEMAVLLQGVPRVRSRLVTVSLAADR